MSTETRSADVHPSAQESPRWGLPVGRALATLTRAERDKLVQRVRALDTTVAATVSTIIDDVRTRGDNALRDMARHYDGVTLTSLEIPLAECRAALQALADDVRAALEYSAAAIRLFHEAQLPGQLETEVRRGVKLGRRFEPLSSVGVYAPGGRAAYPSSVLMGIIPARVAGVDRVVVATPPGSSGKPAEIVLAACALGGASQVLALGGAGAVAALALGTESIERVDKIVGPGNSYVAEAKRQLNGTVGIDCPAGPSEILIVADDSADPELIALELLAQAEHDPAAACVLVCSDAAVIAKAASVVERVLPQMERKATVEQALRAQGALLLADDESDMLDFAEAYAPEHLLLLTREPRRTLQRVRAAGSVFLGPASSVAFGDYSTGANHVLPTAGLSRTWAGLSSADFLRAFTWQELDDAGAAGLSDATALLADAEGLPAHAQAARRRARSSSAGSLGPALRPAYRDIELYDPQRAPCEIDLSDNTNLFGVAPSVRTLLADLPAQRITRYPTVFAGALKEAIADWFKVQPENVVTGCGSDDVIDSAVRAFCEPGDRVVFPDPTFGMVSIFARMNVTRPVAVPMTAGLELDVEALARAGGRLTYICRPNNPTGSVFASSDIAALAATVPGILLLDEAYADFADEDFAAFARASERVVSLRTFSKAFGLAGLRIGFAIGPAALVHEIEKSRGPYKVNSVAEAAALALLANDADWVRAGIEQVKQNRERLSLLLRERGYSCLSSGGNFVLVGVPTGQTAATLAAGLRKRGVAVRPFGGLPHLGDCVRVTVGPWPLMERFLTELAAT